MLNLTREQTSRALSALLCIWVGKTDLRCLSGSCLPLPAGLARSCRATRAVGSTAWKRGNNNVGEVLGRVTAKRNPGKGWGLLEITSEVARFLYSLLSSNF